MLALCKKYILISFATAFLFSTANVWAENNLETTVATNTLVTELLQSTANSTENQILFSEALDFQTFQERTKQVKS